jgi:DNA-binding transcriptional LysR family regulator
MRHRVDLSRLVASLSFDHLWTFVTVVRAGSFSRAADELFLTQPAISQRIHFLEEILGGQLFARHSRARGIEITHLGAEFYEFSQQAINILENFNRNIQNRLGQDQIESLHFAYPPGIDHIASYLFEIVKVNHHHLQVRSICSSHCTELEASVLDEHADIAIYPGRPKSTQLRATPLFRSQLVLVTPPSLPISSDLHDIKRNIIKLPFVASHPGTKLRVITDKWAERVGLSLDVVFESNEVSSLKKAILQGLGMSIIEERAVKHELSEGQLRVVPLPGLPLSLEWVLITKVGRPLPNPVRTLLELGPPLLRAGGPGDAPAAVSVGSTPDRSAQAVGSRR